MQISVRRPRPLFCVMFLMLRKKPTADATKTFCFNFFFKQILQYLQIVLITKYGFSDSDDKSEYDSFSRGRYAGNSSSATVGKLTKVMMKNKMCSLSKRNFMQKVMTAINSIFLN